jgi:hypothetical protein
MLPIVGEGNQIRKVLVRSCSIAHVIHEARDLEFFRAADESVKFEVIPEDQIGVPELELVKVTRAKVDKSGFFLPTQSPFYLKVARHATLDDLKEQIKVACKESDELMTHYRFAVMQGPLTRTVVFDATKVLKKDERVGGMIDPIRDILVWILPADASLV